MINRGVVYFLIVILAGAGIFYYKQTSICRNPADYSIGSFDSRFGISKEKMMTTLQEAELVWEKGIGRDLFNYQSSVRSADVKINLIFDERQAQTTAATQSKEQLEGSRESYDTLLVQYKASSSDYNADLASYNFSVSQFEKRLQKNNAEVAAINAKGGANSGEYQDLQQERSALASQKDKLERERLALNNTASKLNSMGSQLHSLAESLNIDIDIYNQRFGEAREFDQGDYIDGKITIYQFEGIADLRLVLAHEFGHALGLDHVENPKSIMYYLMDKQDVAKPALSKEDIAAFKNRCEFRIPKLQELVNI